MSTHEFSRPIDIRKLDGKLRRLEANEAERNALAARFGLVAVNSLVAKIELARDGDVVTVTGTLEADIVQSCAVSEDDLPVRIEDQLSIRFIPQQDYDPDEEVELDAEDCDEIEYEGHSFDLGEAIAQSLALSIDPYAVGPEAEATRKEAGITGDDAPSGPLAEALAKLKKD
jgi:uncharacterized metal-binding protein YceD (DUF177 family)